MMHYVKERSIILEQSSEEEKTTIKQLINTETVKIVCKALHNEAPKYLNQGSQTQFTRGPLEAVLGVAGPQ